MRESIGRLRQAVALGDDFTTALSREDGAVTIPGAVALGGDGYAELHGAGALLQPLLDDPAVTDVLVNGTEGVWVDRGRGLERAPVPAAHTAQVASGQAVRSLALRLAATAGQRLDDASPIVDGTLPDGTRLHVVLPPLAAGGPLISLRTHRRRTLSLGDLLASHTLAPTLEPVLRALIHRRKNVLISGATGTGKTTLLASLLSLVPADQRIVCIEESTELSPDHPHVIHLQIRRANVQRVGEVGLADLVRAALRMRPDRMVLGECRGAEVREVLSALNTGHEGGWATVHANTAQDVPARLTALGALAGMNRDMVAAQAVSAIDAVIHLMREEGERRVAQLAVLTPNFTCEPVLNVGRHGAVKTGSGWQPFARDLGCEVGAG